MTTQVSPVEAVPTRDTVLGGRPALVAQSYLGFEQLPAKYDRLFEQASLRSPFNTLAWYRNLAHTTVESTEQVRIVGLELPDGTPVAALPLRHERSLRRGWKLRTLSSFSNYYTTLYEPLLDPSYPMRDALRELARVIVAGSPAWDTINLKPMDRESPLFAELELSFREAGMVVQTYFCHGNWYFPLHGKSYKEYLASLRSSVRNIANSKNKKLERSGRARFEIISGQSGLDSAIKAYEKVYAASWKVQEPYPDFVPGLIRAYSELGWLRLGIAYIDNEPAAAQLWIVSNGTASIYKIAYDQKFKDLSIGSYLTTRMVEQTIETDHVQVLDYLSGDDRYKSDWMSDRREHWGILAMNPRTIGGAAAIVRHVGGRVVKRTMQKFAKKAPKPPQASPKA